jgi:hypothetical protein
VKIANDTPYGLSSYVTSGDLERARKVAKQMRAGNVHLNGAQLDFGAPFGGYKQSGNGREWGDFGPRGVPRAQGHGGLRRGLIALSRARRRSSRRRIFLENYATSPARRFNAFSRPINGSSAASSGPWSRPVSAWRSGMNSALPLAPVSAATAWVQLFQVF